MRRTRFKIRGGAGVLRGNKVERIFGESKILSIGGGTAATADNAETFVAEGDDDLPF